MSKRDSFKTEVRTDQRTQAFAALMESVYSAMRKLNITPEAVQAEILRRAEYREAQEAQQQEALSQGDTLIGVQEVAAMAQVPVSNVSNWIKRYSPEDPTHRLSGSLSFPTPIAKLKCGPVYSKQKVERWLAGTGRLK
jgi:hypothetical protein